MSLTQKVEKTTAANTTTETTVITPVVYDWIKRFVQVILPAFSALYLGMAQLYDWSSPEKVVGTVALITTFLGVSLNISSGRYVQSDAGTVGEFVVNEDGGGAAGYRLVLNENPEDLANQERITFKVNKNQS
jgi:type III secretory pathway component EscV